MPISHRLRLFWCLLVALIAIASLLPNASLHRPPLNTYLDSGWTHFLAYAAVATLCLFAWKRRTGLALTLGLAVLSIALQVIRGLLTGRATDSYSTVINLLGIAAGILLGLNILTLRSRARR